MKKSLLIISMIAVGGLSAHAALLVYEGMDYDTGSGTIDSVGTANTGTGFGGAWQTDDGSASFTVGADSQSWGTLPTSGNKLNRTETSDATVSRSVSADLSGASELWFSLLLDVSDMNGSIGIATGAFEGYGNGIGTFTNAASGGFAIEVDNGGTCNISAKVWGTNAGDNEGDKVSLAGQHFLVGQITFDTDGEKDTFKLYNVGTDFALGTAFSTATAAVDESLLDTLSIASKRRYGVDEIRMGTSYVDVIPEPATLGLVTAFGAGVLFIRRRFMI
ncbi:PEP-CTERM sorting domain-containing protein [Pontiella sulfatireligans]|uniref:PEP-CTERM protein-sorting domain-containing protein n=1 Tax=Pontiella sulfatireligans TaxID=2750658 RepID=A0A6C2UGP9_9BACT|nr:PEP-CTERM sorting domain-containing protein [Pontiella sulfatireligans]VGO19360.1 hypothetical protein SCARR_01418 [Pontiella sulfatireligans]